MSFDQFTTQNPDNDSPTVFLFGKRLGRGATGAIVNPKSYAALERRSLELTETFTFTIPFWFKVVESEYVPVGKAVLTRDGKAIGEIDL